MNKMIFKKFIALSLVFSVVIPLIPPIEVQARITDITHEEIKNIEVNNDIPTERPEYGGNKLLNVSEWVRGAPKGNLFFGSGANAYVWNYIFDGVWSLMCLSPESLSNPGKGGNPVIITDPIIWHLMSLASTPEPDQAKKDKLVGRASLVARGIVIRKRLGSDFLLNSLKGDALDYYKRLSSDFRTADGTTIAMPVIQTEPQKPLKPVMDPFEKDGFVYYVYDVNDFQGVNKSWANGPFHNATAVNQSGAMLGSAITALKPVEPFFGSTFNIFFNGNEWGGPQGEALADYRIDTKRSQFALGIPIDKVPTTEIDVTIAQQYRQSLRGNVNFNKIIIGWSDTNGQESGTAVGEMVKFQIKVSPFDEPGRYNLVRIFRDGCPNEERYSAIRNRIESIDNYSISGSEGRFKLANWRVIKDEPVNLAGVDPAGWGIVPSSPMPTDKEAEDKFGKYHNKKNSGGGGDTGKVAYHVKPGDTLYLYYESEQTDCDEDCPPGANCPEGDCSPSEEIETTDLRWYNLPLAFAETKMGVGYQNDAETVEGKFTLPRSGETFEAMMGVPETEKLYVNGGGSEGQMDIKYQFVNATYTFALTWSEDSVCPGHPCGKNCIRYCPQGTRTFCRSYTHNFRYMHFDEADYRTPSKIKIKNPDLYALGEFDVPINTPINASHELTPNDSGLQVGPGVGSSTFNHGAENAWKTSVTLGSIGSGDWSMTGPRLESEAISKGNTELGDIFAQNDKLDITIGGKKYEYVESVNKKTTQPFGNNNDLHAAIDLAWFEPGNEGGWDSLDYVPIFGYTGQPEDDRTRNSPGSSGNNIPFIKEDLEIVKRQVNGVYDFQNYESSNYMLYDNIKIVKGAEENLHSNRDKLKDRTIQELGTPVTKESHYITPENPNAIMLQYTNWQSFDGSHAGKEPDGARDETFDDNPNYYSINPVLIHNPTPAIYAWISDIPEHQLQDQRIVEGMNHSSPGSEGTDAYELTMHPRAYEEDAPARQYVDFDFKLYIPNDGPFVDYWEAADAPDSVAKQYTTWHAEEDGAHDSNKAGIIDINEVSPGTRGKGYTGVKQEPNKWRSWGTKGMNHYWPLGTQGYFEQDWNVAKWISSKYVKFPYDVYYYKNSGEVGGDPAGFYDAGTWIRLYDDNYEVNSGDPTEFNFHIESHQKDMINGVIDIVAENINAKTISIAGNAQELFNDAEWYIRG